MAYTLEESYLFMAQSPVEICEQHNRKVDQYCMDCKIFLCLVCARLSHVKHNSESVHKLANDKKNVSKAIFEDIREHDIPLLNRRIDTIDKLKEENEEKYKTQSKLLSRHYSDIARRLTEMKKDQEKRLSENLSRKNVALDALKSKLEQKADYLTKTCKAMERGKMSDYQYVESFSSLEDSQKTISRPRTDILSYNFSLHFQRQSLDMRLIESLAGTLADSDHIILSETNSFVFGADGINSLLASSEVTSWLYEQKGTQIVQVGIQGEVLRTVDLKNECDAFTLGPNNEIIATHLEAQSITIITSSETFKREISTSPLEPEGISLANNDCLLVTLVDNSMEFSLNERSRRLVRLMAVSGEVIRDYEYREDRKTRMFTLPRQAIQRKNDDICVLDYLNEKKGILHVISNDGEKLAVYTGRNLEKDFFPTDVVADDNCNVILTDPANNVLHLLDSEGQFLKLLTPQQDSFSIPISLSLFGDTMWVGNFNGRVSIYHYRNHIR